MHASITTFALLAIAPTLIFASEYDPNVTCDQVPKTLPVTGCPSTIEPICGSDGQTYLNSCVFAKTACVNGMKKLYDGRCEAKDACPSRTCDDAEDAPVCGSDKKTYKNSCLFLKMLCSYPEFPVAITPVDASGKCKGEAPSDPVPNPDITCENVPKTLPVTGCPSTIEPICGSDGQTYLNSCVFTKTACVNGMTKLYDGRCEAKDACPSRTCDDADDSPVCGSDGKKYKNSCSFLKMLCSYPEFPVAITPADAYGGECKATDHVDLLPSSTSLALSYVATKSLSPSTSKPNYLVDSGSASVKSFAGVAACSAVVFALFF